MANTNHSGAGCCGGAAKVEQSKPLQAAAQPRTVKGCGCGSAEGIASHHSNERPASVTKAESGCCGGAKRSADILPDAGPIHGA